MEEEAVVIIIIKLRWSAQWYPKSPKHPKKTPANYKKDPTEGEFKNNYNPNNKTCWNTQWQPRSPNSQVDLFQNKNPASYKEDPTEEEFKNNNSNDKNMWEHSMVSKIPKFPSYIVGKVG